jgi:hypothetical protein
MTKITNSNQYFISPVGNKNQTMDEHGPLNISGGRAGAMEE